MLTGSIPAQRILDNWGEAVPKFKKILRRDYRRVQLERKLREEEGEPAAMGRG